MIEDDIIWINNGRLNIYIYIYMFNLPLFIQIISSSIIPTFAAECFNLFFFFNYLNKAQHDKYIDDIKTTTKQKVLTDHRRLIYQLSLAQYYKTNKV